MLIHTWWYHWSHESQQTPGVVHLTALWHMPHGNLTGRGPGFGSSAYDWLSSICIKYSKTSLCLATLRGVTWVGVLLCSDMIIRADLFDTSKLPRVEWFSVRWHLSNAPANTMKMRKSYWSILAWRRGPDVDIVDGGGVKDAVSFDRLNVYVLF